MTTTLLIDGSRAPEPAAAGPRRRPATGPAHRLSFGGVLRSERIKLLSLRSIRITLLCTVLAGLALSAMMALIWKLEVVEIDGPAALQSYLLTVSTFASPFLALVIGVLGVFAITSEYSSGMILSSLAAVPTRRPVFLAKAIVTAALTAVTALALVLGGLVCAIAFLPAAAGELASLPVLTGALGTVAYLVLIALLAFGIAALLRSTAGGIAVIAGITFVLPIAFQMLGFTGWEWVSVVSAYLPASLGSSLAVGTGAVDPSFGIALLAMAVWAAAALIPAGVAFQRRDAR
ncbi:ABC transporter permease [Leucobacter allii]|uniref:ABC transporter permease subunit n=1 Tax=Leucobacter allii TaxID=2932247 RepID=UPI001FD3C2F6|nr:ABC transporter permease subunit [Leucobacter allii]UOR03291.1 ABC transporter permease [Leucobacter allii]